LSRNRLEAFSDGVIAILITIMVLELRAPENGDLAGLRPLLPVLVSYILSFTFIGIYWNNHHHLFQAVERVDGRVLWANLHLLFWLSLIPFGTAWMGQNPSAPWPISLYGIFLLGAALAFYGLVRALLALHTPDSTLAKAIGRDSKGQVSIVIYAIAIPLAHRIAWMAIGCYVVVAIIWLIPDQRIEKRLTPEGKKA
jgi:uncharacterized membrane protein